MDNFEDMFRDDVDLSSANKYIPNTMLEHLGIEFTELGEDFLAAKMPVDHRTHQPMGILHGGASITLAETVGSAASNLIVDHATHYAVGLEVNGNHLRTVKSGHIHAKAIAVHIGRKTHIWDIRISDDAGKAVCISRLTMAIIPVE